MTEFHGTGGAPGVALGTVVQFHSAPPRIHAPFPQLRDRAVAHLRQLAARLRTQGLAEESAIFDAQALLAADPALEEAVAALVTAGEPIDIAVRAAAEDMAVVLETLDDPYLRARAADVRAVADVLLAEDMSCYLDFSPGAIVVAHDLTPAQTVDLPLHQLGGFATAAGSAISHTVILARSLGIPAVVGLGTAVLEVPEGAPAIVDGVAAHLIVEPDLATHERYAALQQNLALDALRHAAQRDLPAQTLDGRQVALWANIAAPGDEEAALAAGAEGIGLFRTEFLFLSRSSAPGEDEQYGVYTDVLRRMDGRPVVVRTLDVGGDKSIPYLPALDEPNPFLGERGLRFARRFPELLRLQFRALLRAALAGDVRIMLPMIATLDDLRWARAQLDEAARALAAEHVPHRANVPLGIMVETPAAAVMAERLAAEAAFFSIGSNDLAQYTLAADRTLAPLAEHYHGHDPAVFRLIALVVEGARTTGIPVALCGELAADPAAAEALLGLGVDELSMVPESISPVKERIRAATIPTLQEAARRATQR